MALMLGSASPAPATTEDELIDAARIGDDRAFEELYARYRERISIFIRSRIRDYARAEDVAQDVFISALRRLRSNDQKIAFRPWIYEIAKNACIDEYRRSQRTREVSLEADDEFADGYGGLLWSAPTPPAAMESKQKLDDLRGAFGGLSESHHQLLVMREFEGLSYGEIGRRTGMSRQMVESALFRARRKLGIEYEELASGRRCLQVQTAIEGGKLNSPRALGIRARRQLARHLAHCQPCRVAAHLAGVDESFVRAGVAAKIAALLPFPLLRLWPFGRAARGAALRTGSHPGLQAAAGTLEPGTSTLLGGAAVAVVALAMTGSGGPASGSAHRPPQPIKAATAATSTAAAARSISSQRNFAPGVGSGNTAPRIKTSARLMRVSGGGVATGHYSSVSRRSGSSAEMGGPPAPTRSGKAATPAGTAAASTGGSSFAPAAPAAPGVTRTVGAAQQVLQHPTQTVTKVLSPVLSPVVKTVSKVVSSAPSLPTSNSGSSSTASSSSAETPASTVGNAAGTVKSVTKKLGSDVGALVTSP